MDLHYYFLRISSAWWDFSLTTGASEMIDLDQFGRLTEKDCNNFPSRPRWESFVFYPYEALE